jgi:DNA recombination protein Rad52
MDIAKVELELAKPLQSSVVKSRQQGSVQVSYIEGWHSIAEANRIFGFGGWTRETIEMRLVNEKPRTIGKGQYTKEGFGVSYVAKVRVVVSNGIVREGFGAGHGIDQDLGQAHESAVKEAETDAMKRALMTFGNQFGLALYDKDRSNVTNHPDIPDDTIDHDATCQELTQLIEQCLSLSELNDLKSTERFKADQNSLPYEQFKKLAAIYNKRKSELTPKAPTINQTVKDDGIPF